MTQFHEGQEVEVKYFTGADSGRHFGWLRATIVVRTVVARHLNQYEVQFPNGTRAAFKHDHIRAARQHASLEDIGFKLPGERL